jgi:Oxysterol-binding protein
VQSQSADINDRGKVAPFLCSLFFCCLGAGYNRSKTRKFYKIKGNYFIDCLLYCSPVYCCASVQEYLECVKRKETLFKVPHKSQLQLPPRTPKPISRVQSFHSIDFDENITIKSFPGVPDVIKILLVQADENNKVEISADRVSVVSSVEPEYENINNKSVFIEVATDPLDGNDPDVYSFIIGTGPFSFLKGDSFNPACPPPTYLKLEIVQKPKSTNSKEIMGGLESNTKNGGLVCVDKEALSKQKGIIKEVFKSVISNIAKGLGAVSISLPIRIFEPRSTCERMIDRFSFATKYLKEASMLSNPIDRMKYVMAFAVSGLYLGTKQEKPFNPLLGETFQGYFADGTEVYVEHTAHNPPTDHFDVIGPGFRVFGYYELDGAFSWNDLIGEFRGITYVQLPGQLVSYTLPKFVLGGAMTGDRTLNWQGEMEFQDSGSGLIAAIRIGDDKYKWGVRRKSMKKDDFVGKIWKMDPKSNKKGNVLVSVYGSWLKKFVCLTDKNKEKLWVLDREIPDRHYSVDQPIPSDWRYREDLIWLSKGNLDYAAAWKKRLEDKQRSERQLRGTKH